MKKRKKNPLNKAFQSAFYEASDFLNK